MKKILAIASILLLSLVTWGQNNVTQFLGIPVDGTKSAMIQKLKAKGFTYNTTLDILEGEFNGQQVEISVVTDNNRVYRICLIDKTEISESQIKIRYNNLCSQFEKNSKYLPLTEQQKIEESEDISYEMLVHKKEYQAVFLQIGQEDDDSFSNKTTAEIIEHLSKKAVWFTISEQYGKYRIIMYYDNYYNQSNGEDL